MILSWAQGYVGALFKKEGKKIREKAVQHKE
jgi:hypothetical protein